MPKSKSKLDYSRGSRSPIPAKPVPDEKGGAAKAKGKATTKKPTASKTAAATGLPVVPGAAAPRIRRALQSKKR